MRDSARPEHQAFPDHHAAGGDHRSPRYCSRLGTTSRPTTSCRPGRRFFPSGRIYPISPTSASPSVTRSSRHAARQPGGGYHHRAERTTVRARRREHAALVPLYLGIKAVVAKSFARIHCRQPDQRRHSAAGLRRTRPTMTPSAQGDELELARHQRRSRAETARSLLHDDTTGNAVAA